MCVCFFFLQDAWKECVQFAWNISPQLATQLAIRFKQSAVQNELQMLLASNAKDAVKFPEVLPLLLRDKLNPSIIPQLKVASLRVCLY
jgi:phosphatidylinositol 4-kinase